MTRSSVTTLQDNDTLAWENETSELIQKSTTPKVSVVDLSKSTTSSSLMGMTADNLVEINDLSESMVKHQEASIKCTNEIQREKKE